MMRVSYNMTYELAQRWMLAESADRPGLLATAALAWGVDVSTVRRRLKEHHGIQCGTEREVSTSYVSDKDVKTIAALVARSIRKGRTGLSIEDAIAVAWKDKLLEAERQPASSTVSRRMRELGVNPAQLVAPTPHVWLRSDGPNHVQELDASICIQYAFNRNGFTWQFVDQNKLEEMRELPRAVHRWVLTDHFSGAFVVQYYDSPGERIDDMVRFLHWAWGRKSDSRIPFCGVPRVLYCDRGRAFMSHALQNLCSAYGIELKWHARGNPRATGAAEGTHWIFERKFESKLRLQRIATVAELCERATLEAIAINYTARHTRHGRTRYAAWEEAVVQPVRVPVDDLTTFGWLAHGRVEERTVSPDLTIVYSRKGEKQHYRLANVVVGQKVWIAPHPWLVDQLQVLDGPKGKPVQATLVTVDEWGFRSDAVSFGTYVSQEPTAAEQVVAAATMLPQLEHAFLMDGDLPREVYGLVPVETVPARAEEERKRVRLNRYEAKDRVVSELGRPLTRDEGTFWNGVIGEEIDESALEAAFSDFCRDLLVRVA